MNELRIRVGRDHQHVLRRSADDKRMRQMDCVDVGRTGMGQLKGGHRVAKAQTSVQDTCVRRQDVIRTLRAKNESIDLFWQIRMRLEQLPAGLLAQVERGFAVCSDVAMQNAGIADEQSAFLFPEPGYELVIRQHLRRQRDSDVVDGCPCARCGTTNHAKIPQQTELMLMSRPMRTGCSHFRFRSHRQGAALRSIAPNLLRCCDLRQHLLHRSRCSRKPCYLRARRGQSQTHSPISACGSGDATPTACECASSIIASTASPMPSDLPARHHLSGSQKKARRATGGPLS